MRSGSRNSARNEPGGNSDVYSEGYGYLLKAGSKIKFNMHYHSYGEETTDRSSVGFVFFGPGVDQFGLRC